MRVHIIIALSRGSTCQAHGGHYVAFARHGDTWYACNDTYVSEILSEQELRRDQRYGYILFYERCPETPVENGHGQAAAAAAATAIRVPDDSPSTEETEDEPSSGGSKATDPEPPSPKNPSSVEGTDSSPDPVEAHAANPVQQDPQSGKIIVNL